MKLRWSLTVLVAAVALLLGQSGDAQAHPHLTGTWSAPVPPGGFMRYEFAPATYEGNGVFRGCFTYWVSSATPTGTGKYELRMVTGTLGTIGLYDTPVGTGNVGTVDFEHGVLSYKSVSFQHK